MNAAPNTTVILAAMPYGLRWDKGAMFRADELGLFERKRPGIGLAAAAKYVWCMGPSALRDSFTTPEAVAEAFPPLSELGTIWSAINAAVAASKEDGEKKDAGSTSGRSPASSSA